MHPIRLIPDSNFIFSKKQCPIFRKVRGYHLNFSSQEELDFPLAFSILTYQDAEQFERFLKSIYRSQNIYCVHVDKKSSSKFKAAIESITDCFDNVFIASKLEYVVYAGFSRLKADLNCIQDLIERSNDWKYFLNTASTEFPLRTNLELVQIIKLLNGSNLISVYELKKMIEFRYKFIYRENLNFFRVEKGKFLENNSPPHGIRLGKGSAYNIMERGFLENIFTNKKIVDFVEWLKKTFSPDELVKQQLIRTIIWKSSKYKCQGFYRHAICIYSVGDLAFLNKRKNLFANKFLISYDPISYQCMEERLNKRSLINQDQNISDKNYFLSYFKL
ncbi:N-acetyllactosaminide beta-1-6-N-acetylglucosaminyl-transferase isoform X2 [Brachionus plicatilis]|uniref:N-acetyllactosaminide beta-1-6-N-acetylglucosaminyl-transferase isoform X2 n=1 Tax=Brachionus plicatilis TaxID=10195 RepID=A0A3M7Q075_BRAPC|nr:N-acetyllactosaminide beta-1-6-N-acetylglucosaminyl-transferase isoform X2 [Brachionus plicatilis]